MDEYGLTVHHCSTYSSSFHHAFQQPHSIDLFVRHYLISPYHFNSPHLLVLTTSTPTPQPPHHNHHDYHHHFISQSQPPPLHSHSPHSTLPHHILLFPCHPSPSSRINQPSSHRERWWWFLCHLERGIICRVKKEKFVFTFSMNRFPTFFDPINVPKLYSLDFFLWRTR